MIRHTFSGSGGGLCEAQLHPWDANSWNSATRLRINCQGQISPAPNTRLVKFAELHDPRPGRHGGRVSCCYALFALFIWSRSRLTRSDRFASAQRRKYSRENSSPFGTDA